MPPRSPWSHPWSWLGWGKLAAGRLTAGLPWRSSSAAGKKVASQMLRMARWSGARRLGRR
uniref:Uncharacterized protein n=1 Tax=Arundo donax TaxID=35708 RepID=A0A0A9AKD3_ARUDO